MSFSSVDLLNHSNIDNPHFGLSLHNGALLNLNVTSNSTENFTSQTLAFCAGSDLEVSRSSAVEIAFDGLQNLQMNDLTERQQHNIPLGPPCQGCGVEIQERFMLSFLPGQFWHERCLKCVECGDSLGESCFVRDARAYCRRDYAKIFCSAKCARCGMHVSSLDYVFRCGAQLVYHTQCFQCVYCNQLLKKGDHYFCVEGQIICQRDYSLIHLHRHLAGINSTAHIGLPDPPPFLPLAAAPFTDFDLPHANYHHHSHGDSRQRKIPKRPRTILNAPQRKAFKLAFDRGAKPSRKVREQLAKETGLSVRVVQVWFQNQRAKIKKDQRKRENDKSTATSIGSAPLSTDSDGKSGVDDELKSRSGSTKSELETDSEEDEDVETDEDTEDRNAKELMPQSMSLNSFGNCMPGLMKSETKSPQELTTTTTTDPIERLYHMHHTYFAFS